jgi:ribosomal protein S12 methylthiotransferase accessory factor
MQKADCLPELGLVESLVSPFGPVTGTRPSVTSPRRALGRFAFESVAVGSGSPGRAITRTGMRGVVAGGGRTIDDPARARLIAIAEGAERYSSGDFLQERRILAASAELDGPAVDLGRIPRCSERELSTPGCPLRPLDPDARIRWVHGIDLASGQLTWVPAVMASYGVAGWLPSERFWCGISTGFAVHFDPLEALVGAIFEVIERDINAVLWLQRLPVPLISMTDLSEPACYLLDWSARHFIDTYLFDATSDLGVPAVYCLQRAEYADHAYHVVAAAAARSITEAAEKALLEVVGARGAFCSFTQENLIEDFSAMRDVLDGARYMARPQLAHAFSFLTDGARDRPAFERERLPEGSAETLSALVSALSRRGMCAIAVDRTPRELAAAGLTAVNVVIPDLQPMSLRPLAQYRAHPRLYEAPVLMGYPSCSEEELNPWPQPFL